MCDMVTYLQHLYCVFTYSIPPYVLHTHAVSWELKQEQLPYVIFKFNCYRSMAFVGASLQGARPRKCAFKVPKLEWSVPTDPWNRGQEAFGSRQPKDVDDLPWWSEFRWSQTCLRTVTSLCKHICVMNTLKTVYVNVCKLHTRNICIRVLYACFTFLYFLQHKTRIISPWHVLDNRLAV